MRNSLRHLIRTFSRLARWSVVLWPGVALAQTATLTTPATSYSVAGGSVTFTLTITYTEPTPAALGASVTLPVGWSFASASGSNAPDIVPAVSTTEKADFAYTTVPANSAAFSFVLNYPAGLAGNQTFPGTVFYRIASIPHEIALSPVVLAPPADALPVITSATTVSAAVGVAFSYTATASPAATSFTITGLPAGLSANTTTGVISGTPTVAGVSSINLSATGATGTGPVTVLTITVGNPPAITSAAAASAVLGVPFSFAVQASPAATAFTASGLPAGVTIGATTGVITGTFSAVAVHPVTLTATNAFGHADQVFTITVNSRPAFAVQPQSAQVAVGGSVTLGATATGSPAPAYQWRKNGATIAGATGASLTLDNFQVGDAGSYTVAATNVAGSATSQAAIVGVSSTAKVAGSGEVLGNDIVHTNGNVYDQVLLTGSAATITADAAQVTRVSFIDLNDDIVQVEFSGAGTLTLMLENASGPAAPAKYNQPAVAYMKGHASLIITGANETTNVSVFTVGTLTAINQALFKAGETYDGIADLGLISIASTNARFGGIRTANAAYFRAAGLTGLYAPGIAVQGATYLHDLTADADATPVLVFGATTDVRIAGGDLLQLNDRAVQVDGITHIAFTAGVTSGNLALPAQTNRARFERNGVDITAQLLAPGN